MTQGHMACPCCGAEMEERDASDKLVLKCPSCGLVDVRLKG